MLCNDIIEIIETTYPKTAALSWDNVGLLVGRKDKEVKRIYIALDATDEVIERAISKEIDLLITHHPLIFEPLKQVTDESFISARIVKLLQNDISYYAIHTNYDVLEMAELSATRLGLYDCEVLEITNEEYDQGIGRVGYLKDEMALQDCCELVKQQFHLEGVKVFGELNQKVKRVAISPGSGKHMTEFAIEKQADVFITAEIDHHEGIDAVARGLSVIDAGHYGLEHIFVDAIATFLSGALGTVEIEKEEIIHPFQFI